MSGKVTFGISATVMIHLFPFFSMLLAQKVLIFPKTPVVVDLNQKLTLMCKSTTYEEWQSTLFYDETENGGLSSVGLFHRNTDGTCRQSIISKKYQASCDIAKGEFNLTIRNINGQYHDKIISCTTQFGNGSFGDVFVTKTAKIYVKVPVSDIILSDTEVVTDVSSVYTIKCVVVSRPAATATWLKFNADGLQDDITSYSEVSMYNSIAGETMSSILTIKFSKMDNNGHLLCKANNSFSVSQSRAVPLNIYYPPETRPIIRQVKPGPVDAGDTVYLHCSVYGGYPIAKLNWDCHGLITDQSSESLSAVVLQLVVDRKYDGRICSCSAMHPDQSYKPTIQHQLTVYFSPSIPKLSTIPEMPWFVGNTTNVLCLSEEGKPKSEFQWFVNGQIKKENMPILSIGPLTKNDDKLEIFCKVMNEYTTRHEIMLTSKPCHLDVEYYPDVIFDKNGKDLYAVEGENFTVKCLSNGNPNAMVHWEAKSIRLTIPENSQSVLFVHSIERHQQLFTCHAVSVSTKYGQLVSAQQIEIEIFYRPNISKIEVVNKLPITEGKPTTLQCQVDSKPLSNISWVFLQNQTVLSENYEVSSMRLNISSTHCFDTGIYQCKAESNIHGKLYTTTAQTSLNVICSPRLDSRFPSLPNTIAVAYNETLNVTVRLVAFPPPLINWYFLSAKINSSSQLVLTNTVTTNIVVQPVQKTDLGQYTLNVINSAGTLVIRISVVEIGIPNPPSLLHLFCDSTTGSIVWNSPFDQGARQKFQIQYWPTDNEAEKQESTYLNDPGEGKVLEYELKGLTEKTEYSIQIIASNSLGQSITVAKCNTTGTQSQSHTKEHKEAVPLPFITFGVPAVVVVTCIVIIILGVVFYCRKVKRLKQNPMQNRGNVNPVVVSTIHDDESTSYIGEWTPRSHGVTPMDSGSASNRVGGPPYFEPQDGVTSRDSGSASNTNRNSLYLEPQEDSMGSSISNTNPKTIDSSITISKTIDSSITIPKTMDSSNTTSKSSSTKQKPTKFNCGSSFKSFPLSVRKSKHDDDRRGFMELEEVPKNDIIPDPDNLRSGRMSTQSNA